MFVVHFSSVCYKALLEVVKLFNHKKAGVTRINKTQNNPIGRRDEKFCKKIWGYHQFTTTTAFPTTFPAESQPQQKKPCVLASSDQMATTVLVMLMVMIAARSGRYSKNPKPP